MAQSAGEGKGETGAQANELPENPVPKPALGEGSITVQGDAYSLHLEAEGDGGLFPGAPSWQS